jgi:hypothetical protein
MFDFNKDGKVDMRDVALVTTLGITLFNALLNLITVLGLGVSLTSNSVPILDCRPQTVAGKVELKCYRPDVASPFSLPE